MIQKFNIRQREMWMMDRPPEDADAGEIARFLEEDFWEQVAEATEGAVNEQSDDCQSHSPEGSKSE